MPVTKIKDERSEGCRKRLKRKCVEANSNKVMDDSDSGDGDEEVEIIEVEYDAVRPDRRILVDIRPSSHNRSIEMIYEAKSPTKRIKKRKEDDYQSVLNPMGQNTWNIDGMLHSDTPMTKRYCKGAKASTSSSSQLPNGSNKECEASCSGLQLQDSGIGCSMMGTPLSMLTTPAAAASAGVSSAGSASSSLSQPASARPQRRGKRSGGSATTAVQSQSQQVQQLSQRGSRASLSQESINAMPPPPQQHKVCMDTPSRYWLSELGGGGGVTLDDIHHQLNHYRVTYHRHSDPVSSQALDQDQVTPAFPRGSIKRVRMVNFLTYTNATFTTGRSFNLITGANGSGKSSMVCALCIGLNGNLSIVGRSSYLAKYVKFGCQTASVHITLSGENDRDYEISRRWSKKSDTSASSDFFINGQRATKQEVSSLVRELNIYLDNLTQFLPQDRVQQLIGMSNVDLLQDTEKVAGSADLFKNHETLMRSQENTENMRRRLTATTNDLDHSQETLATLEEKLSQQRDLQQLIQDHKVVESKHKWKLYAEQKAIHDRAKEAHASSKKECDAMSGQIKPLEDSVAAAKQHHRQAQSQFNNMYSELSRQRDTGLMEHRRQCERMEGALAQANVEAADAREQLQATRDERAAATQRVDTLGSELGGMKDTLTQWQSAHDDCRSALNAEENELQRIATELRALENRKNQADSTITRADRELQSLKDVNNQKLQGLIKFAPDTYKACKWLTANRDKFRGRVYDPPIISLNVRDRKHAKYVDSMLPRSTKLAFLFEYVEDSSLFFQLIKEGQRWKVFTKTLPDAAATFDYPVPKNKWKEFGIHMFLSDMVEGGSGGDAVVRAVLASDSLHMVPLVEARTSENPEVRDSLARRYNVRRMCDVSDYQYVLKPYQYHRALQGSFHVGSAPITEARNFITKVNMDEVKRVQQQLSEARSAAGDVERQMAPSVAERNRVNVRREDVMKRLKAIITDKPNSKTKESILKEAKAKCQRLAREEQECEKRIDVAKASKKKVIRDWSKKSNNLATIITQSSGKLKPTAVCARKADFASKRVQLSQGDVERVTDSYNTLKREVTKKEDEMKESRSKAEELLAAAKAFTGGSLTNVLREKFKHLPDSVTELAVMAYNKQVQLEERQGQFDATLERSYQSQVSHVAALGRGVTELRQSLASHQAHVAQVRDAWLRELRELVDSVSSNFSMLFQHMRCAGQIVLKLPTNEESFSNYGIEMQVKFRAEESLRPVTPFELSGGERSVSTALYIMAIQELTKAPFRVVDEINQGMDSDNERRVINLMSAITSQPGSCQYFMITPKFLNDLCLNNSCRVSVVYKGSQVGDNNVVADFSSLTLRDDGCHVDAAVNEHSNRHTHASADDTSDNDSDVSD